MRARLPTSSLRLSLVGGSAAGAPGMERFGGLLFAGVDNGSGLFRHCLGSCGSTDSKQRGARFSSTPRNLRAGLWAPDPALQGRNLGHGRWGGQILLVL